MRDYWCSIAFKALSSYINIVMKNPFSPLKKSFFIQFS